jgi:hypothetical protein
MRLLPVLALEPPPGYVAFVATHLEPLREQAVSVVGGEDAERLYPEVLTDVAARWRWLNRWRPRPGRPGAVEQAVGRALARRTRRLRAELSEPDPWSPFDVEVWTAGELWKTRAPRPVRSSGATRLADFVGPAQTDTAVVAEAAIAWWHAYEVHRRRRLIGVLVTVFLLVAVFAQYAIAISATA